MRGRSRRSHPIDLTDQPTVSSMYKNDQVSIKRIAPVLIIITLIGGVSLWTWLTPNWRGTVQARTPITSQVVQYNTRFHKHGKDEVIVHSWVINTKQAQFGIVFQHEMKEAEALDLDGLAQTVGAVLIINGGYFTHDFQPVGLVIRDGIEEAALSNENTLSGIIVVDESRRIDVISIKNWSGDKQFLCAIQAGPFLIDPGGKPGIYSDDFKRAKRTAVGKTSDGQIVFLSTTPCTLFELSQILHKHPEKIGVSSFERVLNLDGGPSSGYSLDTPNLYKQEFPESNVPNAIYLKEDQPAT